MNADQILRCQRYAGMVKRYHTWPTITTQTNAEHSWHVARIYIQLFGLPSQDIFYYIQFHDAGEIKWGDLPYPAKSNNPEIKKAFDETEDMALREMGVQLSPLFPEEKARIKIADLLEMWEYGQHEMALGNRLAFPIVERTAQHIGKLAIELDPTGKVLNKILKHMGDFQCVTT